MLPPSRSHARFRGVVPRPPANAVRPLWSVMIPTYNCAETLAQTLGSVLAAGCNPEEMQIEVVDDCSTDDPRAVVEALGRGRVAFHRNPRNLGHAGNFNACLARSRGRLVHLLHGDDWVGPTFYRDMRQLFAKAPQLGAAFCRHTIVNDDGSPQRLSPLERETPGLLQDWVAKIAAELPLQPPAMVVRREVYEALGGFDVRMRSCGEDWEMWLRIAAAFPVGYHPEPLAFYRDRANSLTKRAVRTGQNIRDVRLAASIARSYLPASVRPALDRARANWARWAFHWSWWFIERGDYVAAAAQLREAFLCDPSLGAVRKIARFARLAAERALRRAGLLSFRTGGGHV